MPPARVLLIERNPDIATVSDRAFRDACFQAGADSVFLKPFDFDALLAAVARLVRPAAGAVNAAGGRARPLGREIASKGANDAPAV
jgi:DNA-binding response OmpR family regulator